MSIPELEVRIAKTNSDMVAAARKTDFIEAARLRDELLSLQALLESKKSPENETAEV